MNNNPDIEFIFGGSFDPVHLGHINVINSLKKLKPEWPIRVIPCSTPALKAPNDARFEQRVVMLNMALQMLDNIIIDERENSRAGKSYTLDSLKCLTAEQPQRILLLVVGIDTLKSMDRWYQWQQLRDYCHLIVVNRPSASIDDMSDYMDKLGFQPTENLDKMAISGNGRYYCLALVEKDISSTQIRSQLVNGLSTDLLVQDCISRYIVKSGLYSRVNSQH